MIKLQGLHKYFNKGKQNEIHVINDVTLELAEKGMVAVFGKSGCGKTTLLNVIGGLDGFSSGALTLDGADIRNNTDEIRNKYVGYIFQNYNLNKGSTCFDNVADALRLCGMTDPAEIEKRVNAALVNVDMEKYKHRTPDTLSGGQQQRIAIARAIVKNPKIILADEPTGNLDETNTVMIMDLLKAISRDHLVILVTHEANLVDYYCDTVIELSDGKVANIKNNSETFGFSAKDKNHIYLGELEQSKFTTENTEIEYYGPSPQKPIKLKIVNNGGKLYMQLNTEGVQILDEFSEVKLKDGVYEQKANHAGGNSNIDMSALPAIEGSRYGRLFNVKSSVKSGYSSNFKQRKKGKKVLRGCMCLFAAVIVLMSAVFGTAFKSLIEAREAYNHNVFYQYTPDEVISERLLSAVGSPDSAIDHISVLPSSYPTKDATLNFNLGYFESLSMSAYSSVFRTNAVFLDSSLSENMKLLTGRRELSSAEEILITSAVADSLLELSPFTYIEKYDDLIGLICSNYSIGGKSLIITGVVDSDERSVYLEELALARLVMQNASLKVSLDLDLELDIKEGETTYIQTDLSNDKELPKLNEKVMISGKNFKLTAIKRFYSDYQSWLRGNAINKLSEYNYFTAMVKETTSFEQGSHEFQTEYDKLFNEKYYEYLEYYYSDIDKFLSEYYRVSPDNMDLWLYFEKGVTEAKYIFINHSDYYSAVLYKEKNGKFPTLDYNSDHKHSFDGKELYSKLDGYYETYKEEFHSTWIYQGNQALISTYVVDEKDFIALSKQIGETHSSASSYSYYQGDIYYEPAMEIKADYAIKEDIDIFFSDNYRYTVIHSSDPSKTQAWLENEFSEVSTNSKYRPSLVTPDSLFDQVVFEKKEMIITGIITMSVTLAILSVCMYFIMRSSLMNRIKEIGIYRAIGVSKKNLVFKFLIEAVVLMILTVFIGYLLTSAFIYACLSLSSLVSQMLFYPLWMALGVLAILTILCLFCGTLPIMLLLKKTPSEILAKYDI